MLLIAWCVTASANDDPEAVPTEADPEPSVEETATAEPEPLRHTNPGLGIGIAHLGIASPTVSGHDYGLQLEYRGETLISRRMQFNLLLSTGITQPQNTVAVVDWGLNHAAWTTQAFVDVTEWVGQGNEDVRLFKAMGAFFAYPVLGLSYLITPVAFLISPFAAIGHAIIGPTVSWHTASDAPNGYIEVGVGGALYAHPVLTTAQAGFGPMIGVGAQLGKQSVGVRVLVSPPGAHSDVPAMGETMVSGAFVVGL